MAPVRRRANARGQAIIELALTLPLLLLIVLGVFDFGLMFQRYEVVTNAAREGARVGILAGYADDAMAEASARQRALDYLAVGGVTGGTASAQVQRLPVGANPGSSVPVMRVDVQFDHQHVFVGPILTLFGGTMGVTPLRATSTMRLEGS